MRVKFSLDRWFSTLFHIGSFKKQPEPSQRFGFNWSGVWEGLESFKSSSGDSDTYSRLENQCSSLGLLIANLVQMPFLLTRSGWG